MIDTSMYERILVDFDAGVATITLNRPDKLNAFDGRMTAELTHAFNALDGDDETRAIVVTGAGRAFSAGADLSRSGANTFGSGNRSQRREEAGGLQTENPKRPWEMSTPIIAAINGAAVGMGLTLPCQWDIRIAAEDAKLGFVFNRRGVIPEANSMWIVPRLIGVAAAMELMGTGRMFTGAEALSFGLVSAALPRDEVLPAAQDTGREYAKAAPTSVAITKKLIYRQLMETDRGAGQAIESRLFAWAGQQDDSREGVGAFLEKRDPKWSMSKTKDLPDELR